MITQRTKEGAHKVAYLIKVYPEHTIDKIIGLLQMPSVNINSAIWAAQELGLIAEPDPETKFSKLLKEPEKWEFGDFEQELENVLEYAFQQTAKKEIDWEENQLDDWTAGYMAHDVVIATKRLLERGVLASYEIDDPQLDKKGRPTTDKDGQPVVNTYLFYTLAENLGKRWGEKQFKNPPKEDK